MKYLLDTDWIIDHLRGRLDAITLVQRLSPAGIAVSIITFGEVYEGIYFGNERQKHERGFREFLRGAKVLGISRRTARHYARIRGTLRSQGMLIPQPDILIAATAISHGLELVTRNLRDFQRIPGLTLHQR